MIDFSKPEALQTGARKIVQRFPSQGLSSWSFIRDLVG